VSGKGYTLVMNGVDGKLFTQKPEPTGWLARLLD